MSTPHLVIFDCDGTLVDSQNAIVASMDFAFRAHGLEPPARADILSIVGLSKNFSCSAHSSTSHHVVRPCSATPAAFSFLMPSGKMP